MTDLTRTKCGRIPRKDKHMLNPTILSSYYIAGYRNLFGPLVRKTCDFVRNSMGHHSGMFAYSKFSNPLSEMSI